MIARNEGHRVDATGTERMAAQQPPKGEPCAAQRSMGGDGDLGILRTGGLELAPARRERVQRRRNPAPVKREQSKKNAGHTPGLAATACCVRAASDLACERIRTTSASSFVKSTSRTERRGCRTRSKPTGSRSTWRRKTSRIRRLMRLRSGALPSTLPAVSPTRGPAEGSDCGARNQLMEADWRLRLAA